MNKLNNIFERTVMLMLGNDINGRYLTFMLGGNEYGIRMLNVRDILPARGILSIPQVPDYIIGVIRIPDTTIPVIDLKFKLGLEPTECQAGSRIIVTEKVGRVFRIPIGILVDSISQILTIQADDIRRSDAETGAGIFVTEIAGTKADIRLIDLDHAVKYDEIGMFLRADLGACSRRI